MNSRQDLESIRTKYSSKC